MGILQKLLIANVVILTCVIAGKKIPSLGGLIATMPLTSIIVMVWLFLDAPDNREIILNYSLGVLWGLVPTALFFIAAFACLHRGISLGISLSLGGIVWLTGAIVHQWLLR